MNDPTKPDRAGRHLAWLAVLPMASAVERVLRGPAPTATLWIGALLSIVALLLMRFLAGTAAPESGRTGASKPRRPLPVKAPAPWLAALLTLGMACALWWLV